MWLEELKLNNMHAKCKICGCDLTLMYAIPYCEDDSPIKDGVIGILKHSKVKYQIISGTSKKQMIKIKYIRNNIELEVPTRELWDNSIWK